MSASETAASLTGTFAGFGDFSVTLNITQQQDPAELEETTEPLTLTGELITSSLLTHSRILIVKMRGFYWPSTEQQSRRLFTLSGKTWMPNTQAQDPPDLFILQTISGHTDQHYSQRVDELSATITTVSDVDNPTQMIEDHILGSKKIVLHRS